MHLPMMRNLQRQQRQWVKKYSEIKFVLEGEDELFLSGDNAYRYFRETRGLFTVFLAGIPGENYPLHHPKFQLDERILPYSVETLYKIITTL